MDYVNITLYSIDMEISLSLSLHICIGKHIIHVLINASLNFVEYFIILFAA